MFQMTLCLLLAMFCASAASPEKLLIPGVAVSSKQSDVMADGWKLTSESNVDDGVRPRFHHQVFAGDDHHVFGASVRVQVEFFNDKMMEIVLYPRSSSDLTETRSGVASMHQIEINKLTSAARSDGLSIQELTDIRGQTYISIKVEHVYEEYQNWIRAYS